MVSEPSRQLQRAKTSLQQRLAGEPGYRGIGIVRAGEHFVLRVNVAPSATFSRSLPKKYYGVPVTQLVVTITKAERQR